MKEQLLLKYRKPIMGFAAIWIWVLHSHEIIFYDWAIFSLEWTLRFTGTLGVEIFLFLSGIGLSYSILNHTTVNFYVRRFKRISIPFLLRAIADGLFLGWSLKTFFLNVLGISFFKDYILTFLWFGTAIAVIYIAYPPYYSLFKKSTNKCVFTIIFIFVWCLFLITGYKFHFIRTDLYLFLNRIPIVAFGTLIGYLMQKGIDFSKPIFLSISIPVFLVAYHVYIETATHGLFILLPESSAFIPGFICGISITFILIHIFHSLDYFKITKPIVIFFSFYGTISFEFYCAQELISQLVYAYTYSFLTPFQMNCVKFIVCTLVSIVLYYFVKYFWLIVSSIYKRISSKQFMKGLNNI